MSLKPSPRRPEAPRLGFLHRMRRRDPAATDELAKGRVTFFGDGHAETGDGIVWVDVSRSTSRTFALLWRDASDDGSAVGHRTVGPGRYRLIENGVGLRCEGRLERPNDGHVANTGTFILADWLFTDDLRARLHVLAADGTELIRRECAANVSASFMDDEGLFAAAQLASNPSDNGDDERFVVFDLSSRSERWSKALEVGRAEGVEFDAAASAVWVTTGTFGRVRYNLADGSVDTAALRATLFQTGSGFDILALVEDEIAVGVEPDRREALVGACLRASDQLGTYPRHAARALRIAGELLESTDPSRTLVYWERAIAMDPKVGLAKRVKELHAANG